MFQNAQKWALCDVIRGTPRLIQAPSVSARYSVSFLKPPHEPLFLFFPCTVQKVQPCQSQQEANVFAEADLLIRSMKRRSNTEIKI